jgi:hypothetical protein
MPISRGQMPRQMYGLGSLVKSIGKTVKKIVKSPVAKVAMLGFGANALMPGGLSSLFSGGGGLTGILSKGKSLLGGLSGAQKITGALALGGAFAGMEDQQVEELRQNPEALRGYLAQYYRNLNQGASDEEVNRFVEANMTEYKADGGRMGYQDGTDPTYTGNNMEDLPRGLQMDTTTSNPIPEESSFMENLTLLNEIKGGVSPSTKIYLLKEFMDKALERGEITEERYNEMLMPFFGETGEGITSQIENFERENFAMGSPEENAVQASGIMDLPLNQNPAGITELDLRETGGFIPPVGVKEKADDIPAMLSNNEFVFTADAVRGMGEGNVNKGAQRMYDMMKKLEKGGRV